jgi:hypothetical protein
MPQLARILRGENDDRASPKRRSRGETEAVFGLVARVLDWVPIKLHLDFVLPFSSIASGIDRADPIACDPEESTRQLPSGASGTATVRYPKAGPIISPTAA